MRRGIVLARIFQQICRNNLEFLLYCSVPYRLSSAASVQYKLPSSVITHRGIWLGFCQRFKFVRSKFVNCVLIHNYHVICSLLKICLCPCQRNTCPYVLIMSFSVFCSLWIGSFFLLGSGCFSSVITPVLPWQLLSWSIFFPLIGAQIGSFAVCCVWTNFISCMSYCSVNCSHRFLSLTGQ